MRPHTISFVVACFLGACSDNNLGTGAKGGDDADSGIIDTADGGSANGDHPVCDQYLKCVGDAEPAALPAALQAYGPSGSCWGGDGSFESTCDAACASSMANLLKAYPTVVSCGGVTAVDDGGLDAICETCLTDSCSSQLSTCQDNAACAAILGCVDQCTDPSPFAPCEMGCLSGQNAGTDDFQVLRACGSNSCHSQCEKL